MTVDLSGGRNIVSALREWGATLLAVVVVWTAAKVVYNLFLHPLSKFPGPKLAAATSWWQTYLEIVQGKSLSLTLLDLHAKYGGHSPVVYIEM